MRVIPGTNIPFWFKLWDANPGRYILVHITDLAGAEQLGSPYSLTYSGNRGIYIGAGPAMGPNILVADYQTYLDTNHTQLDNSYLPACDWIEPESIPKSSGNGGITVEIVENIINIILSPQQVDVTSEQDNPLINIQENVTDVTISPVSIDVEIDP